MSYEVKTGVKGAMRVNSRTFDTLEEAEAWAARWRRSNSIGSYWAKVVELKP